MASTYVLPASPLPQSSHNHFRHTQPGHGHSHSHSHARPPSSPNKLAPSGARSAYAPRVMQNGGTHSQSAHTHARNYSHSNIELPKTSPIHEEREDLHIPAFGTGLPPNGSLEKPSHSPCGNGAHARSQSLLYQEFTGVDYGSSTDEHKHDDGDHHDHGGHTHDTNCSHGTVAKVAEPRSKATKLLLSYTSGSVLMQAILLEKDSRRIFYFILLNFTFMIVQAFYGFVTDSLGLLSDSIHMFFDCIALGLGLFASVASKWPPTQRFPYGFGKIETLAGFGNGVFLMLISVEIIIEAVERLADGHETKRLAELFVVSTLGLAVNLVGMAAFGHHHHGHDHSHGGHDHGHSHSHSHDEKHSHSHSHSHDHDHDHHDHDHDHDHAHSHSPLTPLIPATPSEPAPSKNHGHHHHDNENMRGIFLHVLADTMGSAAVIVSTVLIHFLGWPGWDPLASVLIAVLIFLSSIPLVSSCAKRLLLAVPDDVEYNLRETLSGVSDLRGVAGYSVPRFWMADRVDGEGKGEDKGVLGVMHVQASRGADMDDVRKRAREFLGGNGMDVVVQVERQGSGNCWCAGDVRSPSVSRF